MSTTARLPAPMLLLASTAFAAFTLAIAYYMQFIMPQKLQQRRDRKVRQLMNAVNTTDLITELDDQTLCKCPKSIQDPDSIKSQGHDMLDTTKSSLHWIAVSRLHVEHLKVRNQHLHQ